MRHCARTVSLISRTARFDCQLGLIKLIVEFARTDNLVRL